MILPIKHLVLTVLVSITLFAQSPLYKVDGKYRLISAVHLIDGIAYKKDTLYRAVVEVPAGTREKWEVNHKSGNLEWEFKHGKPRKVKFLAYPGNYGFIPQTLSGDGDALDVIVLSEGTSRGNILDVRVIGMLKLLDKGEEDYKIIAVTVDGPFKKIDTLKEMLLKKPYVVSIVRTWFEGYKDAGKIQFLGYNNKKKTLKYIEKCHQKWVNKTID